MGNTRKRMRPFACSSVSLQVVSNLFCCRKLTRVEHAGLTVLIVTICTSISLAFECLGVVLELNVSLLHSMTAYSRVSLWWIVLPSITQGVLSATPLIFIIPSACFLKLSPGRWFQVEKLIPSVLILTGMFVMITGLTMTGLSLQDCSHGREMLYCTDSNVSGTIPPVWLTHSPSFNVVLSADIVQKAVISEGIMWKRLSGHFIMSPDFLFFFFYRICYSRSGTILFLKHYASKYSRTILLLECCHVIAALL